MLLLLLAVVVAAGAVSWQQARQRDPHVRYGRFQLPGFDAYVYVAMAERPEVFTVSPWGYRVLPPALVHALPFRNVVRGHRLVSFLAMALAGGALFAFLRRRGHAPWAALAGVALLGLTPPAARAVETPFLGEPVGLLLAIALLVAIEAGAGWGVLALLAVLEVLAKDGAIVLALLPAVVLSPRRSGRERAVAATVFAVPALLLTPLLRAWWTPHIPAVKAPVDTELLRAALRTLEDAWPATAVAALAGGLLPLALLGALRAAGRAYLRQYGASLVLLVAIAFLAWLNVPSREPVPLFGANFERILVYAVPLLLPLVLIALDRLVPNLRPAAASAPPGSQLLPALLAASSLVLPFVLVDRYRRVDLQGSRDGPLVLAIARETWRTAARIASGDAVVFDPATRRFAWGDSDPGQLGRMRWFLREGWGGRAHYGTGEVVMHAPAATLILPLLEPAELEVQLRMMAMEPSPLAVTVNSHPVSAWMADATAAGHAFRVPARLLVRGDNLLTVSSPEGQRGARLRELRYRRAAP
ncbi:MAG TPA: hypothetical protein VMR21_07720 [Vicinamibacteria bacterium]|nr:hypothetical protein [Vicinamibacteria bacterium]